MYQDKFVAVYKGIELSVLRIYRYLDKFHESETDLVKQISFKHTLEILGGQLSVVFYDVTTLYFEATDEDDLRKTGFSKDGKHPHPQIVLGLLVSQNGYALDYEIFEGNKYEGDTLLPVINHFKDKYTTGNLIVVADSGLLSTKNIQLLKNHDYQYILGARLKNMNEPLTEKILNLTLANNESSTIIMENEKRLIVGYKANRALKDAKNRKRGLDKLEKAEKPKSRVEKNINKRGYNKYLKIDGNVHVSIDYAKYEQDSKWDGLKGYITNTRLPKEEVIHQYSQLWQIEKTFRISKAGLQIRLVYHRLKKRMEARVYIFFSL